MSEMRREGWCVRVRQINADASTHSSNTTSQSSSESESSAGPLLVLICLGQNLVHPDIEVILLLLLLSGPTSTSSNSPALKERDG